MQTLASLPLALPRAGTRRGESGGCPVGTVALRFLCFACLGLVLGGGCKAEGADGKSKSKSAPKQRIVSDQSGGIHFTIALPASLTRRSTMGEAVAYMVEGEYLERRRAPSIQVSRVRQWPPSLERVKARALMGRTRVVRAKTLADGYLLVFERQLEPLTFEVVLYRKRGDHQLSCSGSVHRTGGEALYRNGQRQLEQACLSLHVAGPGQPR